MYEYIKGNVVELTPTYAVVENNGMGYFINISLQTYGQIVEKSDVRLFLHYVVRDDAQLFFGFVDEEERNIFRLLLSVSGIGANTARMILSYITSQELKAAIETDDVSKIKSVKGIGLKTAQRIVVDLKDKISKNVVGNIFVSAKNPIREEAISALVMLGFSKNSVEKNIDSILTKTSGISVEALIKQALKQL